EVGGDLREVLMGALRRRAALGECWKRWRRRIGALADGVALRRRAGYEDAQTPRGFGVGWKRGGGGMRQLPDGFALRRRAGFLMALRRRAASRSAGNVGSGAMGLAD